MISNHLNLVEQQRQNTESISNRIADFLAAGGQIAELKSPPRNPLPPPRSQKINPDTILKRKPRPLNRAERRALRKMADSL
ncbi:hypothetical protein [Pseudomonas lini]|uniref:Uncharacterized protein n=1 Tax=Pseudomonas lini TaxID=163011 RepID=A0A0J6HKQ3_9PSED|nr:hypothetical protein [Pseudomonas lini]KAB0502808.1 hypothetical protein F7R14_19440 [Pseudomonas lini]KMM94914.1 hypothetical protein TU81_00320 [Pseudomonas lini]SDT21144.1 hypothetical protein SAMN04490191_3512 [Pseudomonas lini]